MRWAGHFFGGRSFVWDGDGAVKDAVSIPPSGTLSTFSCPLCLSLSYHVSTTVTLVVPHIFFCHYPLLPSSTRIYFFVPVVSPLFHVSAVDVSFAPHLHIHCHPCPLSLSSPLSASDVLINDSPLHFSSAIILIVLHIYLRHHFYPTSLLYICYICFYYPAYLPLPSPSLRISVARVPLCISTHSRKVYNYPPSLSLPLHPSLPLSISLNSTSHSSCIHVPSRPPFYPARHNQGSQGSCIYL